MPFQDQIGGSYPQRPSPNSRYTQPSHSSYPSPPTRHASDRQPHTDRNSNDYPPHDRNAAGYPTPPERGSAGYHQSESQYPPVPGEEDERVKAYHQRGPSGSGNVTLPSISPYEPQYPPNGYAQPPNGYQDHRGYAPDPYRPPPHGGYRDERAYPQEYARGGPPQQMNFSQSAPRQRTAIACRYCRRRKIRCSGFENNPDGKCVNCQRFQQECIFTPVSSQAQAFVPAHTVFPGMRNMGIGPDGRPRQMYPTGTQLYGAHGQPLGTAHPHPHASQYDYAASSPTGSYGPSMEYSQNPHPEDPSRKRLLQDPHQSILPPPMPNQPPYNRSDSANRRSAVEDDLRLPPVTPTGGQSTATYSPGSSTSSHSNLQPPQTKGSLPSMNRTPPPRTSPAGDGRADPMSLGNIMERRPDTEIDRNMLGRLGRKGQGQAQGQEKKK